jgi:hypothetical protein
MLHSCNMPLVIRGNVLQSRGRIDWLPDGNVMQPGLTFATDPDTGLYKNGPDALSIATGGTERALFDANGTTIDGDLHVTGASIQLGDASIVETGGNVVIANLDVLNVRGNGQELVDIQARNVVGLTEALDVIDSTSVTTNVLTVEGNAIGLGNAIILEAEGNIRIQNLEIAASSADQNTGSSLRLLNNADDATRKSVSIGTFVRDVDGTDSYFAIDALSNVNTYLATLASYDITDHRWSFATQNTERLAVESDGNVTITGNCLVSADIVAFASDRRLKKDLVQIEDALGTLRKLTGYRYTWRDDVPNLPMRGNDMGLVAQEVEDAGLHECVTTAPFDRDQDGKSISGESYLTIQYTKLHALMIEALKQLADRVDQLERSSRSETG